MIKEQKTPKLFPEAPPGCRSSTAQLAGDAGQLPRDVPSCSVAFLTLHKQFMQAAPGLASPWGGAPHGDIVPSPGSCRHLPKDWHNPAPAPQFGPLLGQGFGGVRTCCRVHRAPPALAPGSHRLLQPGETVCVSRQHGRSWPKVCQRAKNPYLCQG